MQENIKTTFPFENIPEYAFEISTRADQSSDQALFQFATTTLEKAKACFIDNEPEAPWLAMAAKLLDEVFAQPELEGMLCLKDM